MNKRKRMEVILKLQRVFRDLKDISEITDETFQLPRKLYVMLFELTNGRREAQE